MFKFCGDMQKERKKIYTFQHNLLTSNLDFSAIFLFWMMRALFLRH